MASTIEDKLVRMTNNAKNWGLSDSETELIKNEFNEKLHAQFLSTSNSEIGSILSNLRSQKCVESFMLRIKKEEEKSREDSSYINTYRDKSKIVKIRDGKEQLMLKDEDGKFKVFLPWEDMFDIFWETHLKYCHPGTETLKHILRHDYIINDFAIQNVFEVCYTCSGAQKPYFRCTLDLIIMNGESNFAFTHIMVYQDMYTGFIHLRPLSVDNRESEICVELFRIFMDFGPPKEVFISNIIFEIALDQIKHLTTFAPFPIILSKVMPNLRKLNRLRNDITVWMKKNKFENWSIACYAVQLHINNEIKRLGQKSPYGRVFRELKSCVLEDVQEMELDSTGFLTSSDIKVDEGSPEDFDAMSFMSGGDSAERASPGTSSPVEAPETYAIITEFKATSDEEMLQFEDKDPLAIDETI